ncbi:MAG: hypothetical protein ACI8UG_001649 [Gammaproteobacteria bacterium]|jgi:hypothetical protein
MGNTKDSKTAYKTTQVAKYIINVHHYTFWTNASNEVHRLAYSRIVCKGDVIVGPVDNPNDNFFACTIKNKHQTTVNKEKYNEYEY